MSDRKLTVLIGALFAVVAAAALIAVYAWRDGGAGGIARIGGPFALVDQDGAARTDEDFRGRYLMIYFGYTFCPDVCPTALADMAIALDDLGPMAARVQPLFVSVDPARDTPQRLKSYVVEFHPRLIGLTGSDDQVTRAARAYRVYYAKVEDAAAGADYLMDHSSIVYLMDPEGRYVTHFGHGTSPETMAERLREALS